MPGTGVGSPVAPGAGEGSGALTDGSDWLADGTALASRPDAVPDDAGLPTEAEHPAKTMTKPVSIKRMARRY